LGEQTGRDKRLDAYRRPTPPRPGQRHLALASALTNVAAQEPEPAKGADQAQSELGRGVRSVASRTIWSRAVPERAPPRTMHVLPICSAMRSVAPLDGNLRPSERREQVVMIGLEPVQTLDLGLGKQHRLGLLGQG